MKVRTTEEYLESLILGEELMPVCYGYPMGCHESSDYQLTIGEGIYTLVCPKCGFGEGGSLLIEDCKRLQSLRKRVNKNA